MDKYDYKPLIIQIWSESKDDCRNFLIDGCTFASCKELAVSKRNGDKYIEIWTRSHKGSIPECLYSDVKNIDIQKEEVDE